MRQDAPPCRSCDRRDRVDRIADPARVRRIDSRIDSLAEARANPESDGLLTDAEYQRRTADLDRRAAALRKDDNAHYTETETLAKRYGMDVSAYEATRKDLVAQRDAAIAHGDIYPLQFLVNDPACAKVQVTDF